MKSSSFVPSVSYVVTCFKENCKVIEISAVRWLDRYEANADFQRDYYKRRKLARRFPGNDDEVSIISVFHIY